MVAQHVFQDSASDATLAVLWRSTALHVPRRAVAGLLLAGIAILAVSVFTGELPILGAFGLLVIAFGAYAATIQSGIEGSSHPGPARLLTTLTSTIAALAALGIGLLLLGAIFGGSLEVMRR